jgi:hypothetical protein
MDPSSASKLPFVLLPGKSVTLIFCYSPTTLGPEDSTTVDWNTDIESPYTDSLKSWSFLKGKPVNNSDVKPLSQAMTFSIRPNPASGTSVILSFTMPFSDKVTFSIFDVLGREIYNDPSFVNEVISAGAHESEIHLPNLESGIYFARLTFGNVVSTQKLEIVK